VVKTCHPRYERLYREYVVKQAACER
jgi:hypothetical protein